MVCAGFSKKNSTGVCFGDSGGPLICHQNGQTVLAGIASWTKPGCNTEMPNVFTRVSNYIDWIQNYTKKTITPYSNTKDNYENDYSQENGEAQEYEDEYEYRDLQENGNSQEKVLTPGLKKALQQTPVSCPKLPSFMRGGAQARIIQGHKANTPIPWQVSIQDHGGAQICGGTILDKTTIISAAHCFMNKKKDYTKWYVLAGKISRQSYDGSIRIARTIVHPEWNYDRIVNDVAIVKLSKPLIFDKNIKPMCLPSKDFKPRIGDMCIVSGWGDTYCKN